MTPARIAELRAAFAPPAPVRVQTHSARGIPFAVLPENKPPILLNVVVNELCDEIERLHKLEARVAALEARPPSVVYTDATRNGGYGP